MTRLGFAPSLALLAIAGCSAGPAGSLSGSEQPEARFGAKAQHALSIGFTVIQVGDEMERAGNALKGPAGAHPLTRLPMGLKKPYSVVGWRTESEGIGVIGYEGRVAVVMRVVYDASPSQEEEARTWFDRQADNATKIESNTELTRASYVTVGRERMAIVIAPHGGGKSTVVQALGVPEVLKVLGLDPGRAETPSGS